VKVFLLRSQEGESYGKGGCGARLRRRGKKSRGGERRISLRLEKWAGTSASRLWLGEVKVGTGRKESTGPVSLLKEGGDRRGVPSSALSMREEKRMKI